MKTRTLSQLTLIVGLAVGLMAVWVGSTPVAGANGGAIGGMTVWDTLLEGVWVATDKQDNCAYCDTTDTADCGDYRWANCNGGGLTVAICGGYARTTYPDGLSGCYGDPWCYDLYDATCGE